MIAPGNHYAGSTPELVNYILAGLPLRIAHVMPHLMANMHYMSPASPKVSLSQHILSIAIMKADEGRR